MDSESRHCLKLPLLSLADLFGPSHCRPHYIAAEAAVHKDELPNHLGPQPLGYCAPEGDLLFEFDNLAAAGVDSDDTVGADVDVDAVVDYAAVSGGCKFDVVVVAAGALIELNSYCLIEGFVQLAAVGVVVAFGAVGGRQI